MYPVLIHIGPFTLATYGVLVAAGYLSGILWLKSQIARMPAMDEDKFWTLVYSLFFGAIAGGKILFILVSLPDVLAGRIHLIRDFRYGFVFFGGLLGSMIAGVWAVRKLNIPYLGTADYFGVALPLGHSIGRLGCLASGCCYGKPTSLPWAVKLGGSPFSTTPEDLWGVPLHPTQVYESLANLAIFLAMWKLLLPRVQRGRLAPGTVFLSYVTLYSCARFVIEFLRGDDRGWQAGGLWVSQWVAIACVLGCAAAIAARARRARTA